MAKRVELLRERHSPASVEICAFLVKNRSRHKEVPVKYAGFEIENVFAVGYGLDHGERFRNLRYVAALAKAQESGKWPPLARGACGETP